MSPESATESFLDILNFVMEPDGFRFEPSTPLERIVKPEVIDPETFIGCIAHALGIEPEEVDQLRIDPASDTVSSMFDRLLA